MLIGPGGPDTGKIRGRVFSIVSEGLAVRWGYNVFWGRV